MTTLRHLLMALVSPVLSIGAIVLALLVTLADAAGLFGLWLAILLFAAIAKYPYAIARSAAAGMREPPPAAIDDFNPGAAPEFLAHAGLVIAVLAWLWTADGTMMTLSALALALLLPASIAIMATSGSLVAAVNPAGLAQLIGALGAGYGLLLAFMLGLAAVALGIDRLLQITLLSRVVWLYALLGTFAATGTLLHLNRFALELPVGSTADERESGDRREQAREWSVAVERIYALLSAGDATRGYAAIDALLASEAHSPATYELLYERLREWRMHRHTSHFALGFVAKLTAERSLQRALEVTEERLRHDPDFRPPRHVAVEIAAHARAVGHASTAAMLEVPISPVR
jgi:hypothetical protein